MRLTGGLRVIVCLAEREYEAWFLAAAESLRGRRGLVADLEPPARPETIRGAKEWLRGKMEGSRTYSETTDQAALSSLTGIWRTHAATLDGVYLEAWAAAMGTDDLLRRLTA